MSDIQNQQQPLADALTEALAEIERLRAEVARLEHEHFVHQTALAETLNEIARLEAVVALQRGSMQPHRDEYEMARFQWNVPPDAPGNVPR